MVCNNCCERAKDFTSRLVVKGLVRAGMTQEQWWKCRECTACCISCKRCYCLYLTRIPVCSIIAIFWLAIGFTGFAYGMHEGVEGLKLWLKMDILDLAQMGLMAMGIFFGAVSFLAFLNGMAATGRTRFNVYSGWKSKCAGRCCIFWLMMWHLLLWFLWMFLAPLMIIPVIFMGIFFAVCQVKLVKQVGRTCIEFAEYGLDDLVNTDRVCGAELIDFCAAMTGATPYFVAAFVGGIFIVVGVFIMTLVLAANYVHVKNHRKREIDSECSICRRCCKVPDPEFYDECWPEPPVEEVQLSMKEKLKLSHADDPEGNPNPHGQQTWTYIYDFDKDPGKALKKY